MNKIMVLRSRTRGLRKPLGGFLMKYSDFANKCLSMANPAIKEKSGDTDLLSTYWIVFDNENSSNKFCTPLVRLSIEEYRSRDHSAYYAREQRFRNLYNRWLKRHLTKRAVDLGDSAAFLALSQPEVLSTSQADSTPAPNR